MIPKPIQKKKSDVSFNLSEIGICNRGDNVFSVCTADEINKRFTRYSRFAATDSLTFMLEVQSFSFKAQDDYAAFIMDAQISFKPTHLSMALSPISLSFTKLTQTDPNFYVHR